MNDNLSTFLMFIYLPVIVQYIMNIHFYMLETGYPYLRKKLDKTIMYGRFAFGVTKAIATAYWRRYFPKEENVKQLGRSKIEVSYKYRDNEYKFRTRVKRGVSSVFQFVDETGENVTSVLAPYIGPGEDFHSIKYTPADFGYKRITVYKDEDDAKAFEEYQDIEIE